MIKTFGGDTLVELVDDDKTISCHIQDKLDRDEDKTTFFIGDLGDVIKKYKIWQATFPRIEAFYAVKCNDLQPVLKIVADMGLSFDCASQLYRGGQLYCWRKPEYPEKTIDLPSIVFSSGVSGAGVSRIEIEKVLGLGVDPSRIVYANSIKQTSFIKYSAQNGVDLMTFDNEEELFKVKSVYPNARLLLRICPPSHFNVKYYLGKKFGCPRKKERHLLEVAKQLGLNVVGVSFHVGSDCLEAGAFEAAIRQARGTFDIGLDIGIHMDLLDIGGGIPGQEMENFSFEEMAEVVNQSLDQYFPDKNTRVIAEPGRFFVASAFTVATNIIGKRIDDEEDQEQNEKQCESPTTGQGPIVMYYVNNGIYGDFNTAVTDPGCFVPLHLKKCSSTETLYKSIIWGPTCDALDMIIQDFMLPELAVGDWIYFKDMGAYTMTTASNFNNMPPVKQYFICSRKLWEELYTSDGSVRK